MKTNVYLLPEVIILLAPGFDDTMVYKSATSLRKTWLSVSVVGLTPENVYSMNGHPIYPDFTIDQFSNSAPPLMAFIPGDDHCAAALVSDARVCNLLRRIDHMEGLITVAHGCEEVLNEAGFCVQTRAKDFMKGERIVLYDGNS